MDFPPRRIQPFLHPSLIISLPNGMKISILPNICLTFLFISVLRIWRSIKTIISPYCWFSLFLSPVRFTVYWYCIEWDWLILLGRLQIKHIRFGFFRARRHFLIVMKWIFIHSVHNISLISYIWGFYVLSSEHSRNVLKIEK